MGADSEDASAGEQRRGSFDYQKPGEGRQTRGCYNGTPGSCFIPPGSNPFTIPGSDAPETGTYRTETLLTHADRVGGIGWCAMGGDSLRYYLRCPVFQSAVNELLPFLPSSWARGDVSNFMYGSPHHHPSVLCFWS